MSETASRRLNAALATSRKLPHFIELNYLVWAPRIGSPPDWSLLQSIVAADGIINRRGKTPDVRTISRAWRRHEDELEARRKRELAISMKANAWRRAIDVAPRHGCTSVHTHPQSHFTQRGRNPPVANPNIHEPRGEVSLRKNQSADDDDYVEQRIRERSLGSLR